MVYCWFVVHTFNQLEPDLIDLRIISARKAEGPEIRQYRGEE